MADLKKEAESLDKAATALRKVSHHTTKPLHEFKAESNDLSALGALGSLMSATDDIRGGMRTLAKLTHALDEEWHAEAKLMGEVSDAFDLLDVLLAAAARGEKG
ncbi:MULTISPECIES: hypothetical protein [unclassified Streptomyces]|uniref:hypothetical protein n=1 Tax=unclassified Streptomyces TaxID=2593676 RepID=UPI002DDA3B89|nr:hypothetical protein [Streptomyces sp. NBC_00243]WRZ22144.1 hypothetical protein OHT59_28510 [Streptomyces sp. NBC_00243]